MTTNTAAPAAPSSAAPAPHSTAYPLNHPALGTSTDNNTNSSFLPGLSSSASAAVASRGIPATLNLDDIFGDCFFTPDGDTLFLSDQPSNFRDAIISSGEAVPATCASRPAPSQPSGGGGGGGGGSFQYQQQQQQQPPPPQFIPVAPGGGISTTNLDKPGQPALVMGPAPSSSASASGTSSATGTTTPLVPFVHPPQQRHHLQFATPAMIAAAQQQQQKNAAAAAAAAAAMGSPSSALQKRRKNSTGGGIGGSTSGGSSSSIGGGGGGTSERKMSDQQKVERRERNREHAKRSRIRKKFLLESLQQSVTLLKDENEKLRNAIRSHLGDEEAGKILSKNLAEAENGLIASSSTDANKVLDDPDFSFIKALQTAQQNFVVTDPSLPDNPIVYATQGFLNLTGYSLDQVLGRNCRFLQGPETDPKAVEKIRKAIEEGSDTSVCLLNYRVDGSTFWNQLFIAALRDAAGNTTNFVGVQCKVSDQYAANVCKKQEEELAALAKAAEEEKDGPVKMETDMEGDSGEASQSPTSAPASQ